MKTPPPELADRLLDASEEILFGDPAPRLEDVARLVGTSRATLYYYFSGRDDLLAFLLTAHAKRGADAIRSATKRDDPPTKRLHAMVTAMIEYLGQHPGMCAGLLTALGATGRMSEVLQTNDTWIAAPLRELLTAGRAGNAFAIENVADAANAILGAILLGVLSRTLSGADATDPAFQRQLAEQVVQGVMAH
jgi:AcrR family transcriptional regulator